MEGVTHDIIEHFTWTSRRITLNAENEDKDDTVNQLTSDVNS